MKNTIYLSRLLKIFGLVLLLISIIAINNDVQAQRKSKNYLKKKSRKIGKYKGGSIHFDKNKRFISLGASVDALNYFGDIAPKSGNGSTKVSFTRPSFSVYGLYRVTPHLSLRGSFSWGRLLADDEQIASFNSENRGNSENSNYRYIRNLSFRNDIKELAFVGVWDFFPNHGSFLNRVSFTPYVFGGVAVLHHNPKGKAPALDKLGQPLAEAGNWVALRELGTEGQLSPNYDIKQYSLIQPSIPFGLGIRAKLNKRLDFEFEIGYRFLFTDYIDDISGVYVDLGALDSELARAMSDRSREPIGATSGNARPLKEIEEYKGIRTYTSQYDGRDYTVIIGYGQEDPLANDYKRGSANDNDIYITTSLKISYIISGSFKRAKFR